ncbi:hypothetical protein A1O3_05694 [Capronia epimyces CBS 606.96]|uniref:N-acetyltransferase domain-containing protein n=1 Tax=Capronia epimyces CBS 606.96 TaxID=1182542 RepID=W9YRW2_9EURO|nr:uncharacterized protein A1O3_05694 [Capronia epimyces CBS 606.96]EXJ85019.1 hypothetical protein A1O3_05694 [Capronia epimyces CBS 606.96]
MATFSIRTLPNPAPSHDALLEYSSRLQALRLRSLKQDPSSFISTYENEVDQPQEFWLQRILDPKAIHLVVVRNDPEYDALDKESGGLMKGEWVGFVVIIAPDWDEGENQGHESPPYLMAALYVTSDCRGLGLGKRLVQATLDTVKQAGSVKNVTSRSCITHVRHGNKQALALYQKMGFQAINPNEHTEKEGRTYNVTTLRIDL